MISPTITDELEEYTVTKPSGLREPELQPGRGCLVFDIETGPASNDLIRSLSEPYAPPPHPGEFDPRSVRTGNLKDPAKIQAKIDEAAMAHAMAKVNYVKDLLEGEAAYWQKITDEAPLSAILGRVLAIGFCDVNERTHTLAVGSIYDDDAEADIIDEFWCKWYRETVRAGHSLIGHYIAGFDIPFLMRRSWILGVDVPPGVIDGGKWLSKAFIDTKAIWECGARGGSTPGGLDILGRVFGEGGKTEDMTGADFWKLFYSGEPEKVEEALAYLRNDVVVNSRVARRMGVM